MTQLRVVADERRQAGDKPNPASSILKLKGSELQQACTELLMDVAGPWVLPDRRGRGRNEPQRAGRSPPARPPPISTCARFRSTAAPTRSSATSSPRRFWGSDAMDFDLSDEQRLLTDSLDRLIADRYALRAAQAATPREPDGWSREMWAQFAELGLLGLPFDEAHGGFGGGPVETDAGDGGVRPRPGAGAVPGHGGAGGGLVRRAGSGAQQAGRCCRASPPASCWRPSPTRSAAARYDLADVATVARAAKAAAGCSTARKALVLHGDAAELLVATARTAGGRRDRDGIGLFLVDAAAPGVTRRRYPTQDGLRAAEIAFARALRRAARRSGRRRCRRSSGWWTRRSRRCAAEAVGPWARCTRRQWNT